MILEGIVTTMNEAGDVNIAPMGPIVPESPATDWRSFILRPFKSSTTYANLNRTSQGVLHVTDDVLLIAQAVLGNPSAATVPAVSIHGRRLADCCRFYEFEVEDWDESDDRTQLVVQVKHIGRVRDFFGFNRAMFAVLEAAILASRTHLLEAEYLREEMDRLQVRVEKTAGPRERQAFDLLAAHIYSGIGARPESNPPPGE